METIPNFDNIFERKSTEEVQSILDSHLSMDEESPEVEKYGSSSDNRVVDAVEQSFNELLGS